MEQRDEAPQQGGPQQSGGAAETTGAVILQQSASQSANQQFGGIGGSDDGGQQSQRGAGSDGAKPPRELLKQTAEDLRREGGELARTATQQVETLAEDQKARASGYVGAVARAMQSASQAFEQQGFGGSAHAIDQIAEQMDELAETLRSREPKDMMHDVTDFARQNPALFLGASMMAGFGLARFIKSGVMPPSDQAEQSTTERKP